MLRVILTISAALAVAGCTANSANYAPQGDLAEAELPPLRFPETGQEALRPYYAGLDRDSLPVAGPNAALDESKALTRIAFGSCYNENRPADIWGQISKTDPDMFLMIGDNIYGDTGSNWAANLPSVQRSYAKLAATPEFQEFRANIPMMTSWDDHDYGANDAGGAFAFKEYAERLYETFWDSPREVKARPGVYESRMVGPEGKKVQIILLDTRYFRSDLLRKPYRMERWAMGNYAEDSDPEATILGDAQWEWLAQELRKPADLRLIFSSIQVITKAHDFESWSNFPLEQERLYSLLTAYNIDNAVLLSGDRHSGGLYRTQLPGKDKPLWELTSSSLNYSFRSGDTGDREPDEHRVGGFFSDENFGQIDIDWDGKKVKLTLTRSDGETLISQDVPALQ
ncbi:alkaline phosphatase D family protein [Alterisphingorhabdus coralli]|uniref:Alkaline phosphatase D family protein n=1 Tax=Alterisphingorhabdus coralli TaxID=3071408 RepID=A0AA97F8D5_9SPHN|nr:alkaline phosphatase D family protein [Parasphingorhabdus sp. SCSIO 66989]WOE74937.1 alkaline phosphatase D family protein [Parasphingorhabdus sp. SCSIO 66989]